MNDLLTTPKLTQPIQAFDVTKSVEENMAGKGNPSARNIFAAYQTPQAKLQLQQKPSPVQKVVQEGQRGQYQPAITSMDDLARAMSYTTPQEEDRLRRASLNNQRILAVGDALRHIGNIATTVHYAPSQQFNSPVLEEYSRYEKGKALRDAANYKFLTYQQQKAAQDEKRKQWETQFKYNMAKDAANYELKKNESEARQQRQKALAELDKARLEGQIDKNTYQRLVAQYYPETAEAKIREIESRIAKNSRTGGGGGRRGGGSGKQNKKVTSEYEPDVLDSKGKVVKKGKRTTYTEYGNYHPSGMKKTGINWGAKKKSAGIKNWQ